MGGGREKGLGKTTGCDYSVDKATDRQDPKLTNKLDEFRIGVLNVKSYLLLQLPLQPSWCSCSRQESQLQNLLEHAALPVWSPIHVQARENILSSVTSAKWNCALAVLSPNPAILSLYKWNMYVDTTLFF